MNPDPTNTINDAPALRLLLTTAAAQGVDEDPTNTINRAPALRLALPPAPPPGHPDGG